MKKLDVGYYPGFNITIIANIGIGEVSLLILVIKLMFKLSCIIYIILKRQTLTIIVLSERI